MLIEALFHETRVPYACPENLHSLRVRLRAGKGEIARCLVLHADRYELLDSCFQQTEAEWMASDQRFDYFEALLECTAKRLQYVFLLEGKKGERVYFGESGVSKERNRAGVFQYAYIHESALFVTPEWARDAVVYQIFPDRFANGDKENDPPRTEDWSKDARPGRDSFYGGDLEGVIHSLPYLRKLGVNALYFTPIFASPSNHKYDTADYLRIDPQFGNLDTFKRLIREAHRHGMRIILDAVFNHSGDRFFAFRDVLEKGADSQYRDWFFIEQFPVVQTPQPNYETFAVNVPVMPKLRTENREVKEYLFQVVRYWTEMGIDGWRLDVANEVDHAFWRDFRSFVKMLNPEALIIGEVWHNAVKWLEGDQFDSVMNYLFRDCVYRFFAEQTSDASEFDAELTTARISYPDQALQVAWNLLDSHDTERFLTSCGEKEERFRLAVLFQMTYVGTPLIYYGDEIGMTGETDPDCRRPMLWDKEEQNQALFSYYQRLIRIRRSCAPLRRGSFRTWLADPGSPVYAFVRSWQGENAGIVLNNSDSWQNVSLPLDTWAKRNWTDLLTGEKGQASGNRMELILSPYQGIVLV
uniref:Cyclomaltodextrinase n=1 Tax=Laceyella sacchari TaxID=37482 RepID=Q5BLZ7_LACSH|nr:cyclomaltodextrinase [Laceyella sacchari]